MPTPDPEIAVKKTINFQRLREYLQPPAEMILREIEPLLPDEPEKSYPLQMLPEDRWEVLKNDETVKVLLELREVLNSCLPL